LKEDTSIQKKMLLKDYANRLVSESNELGTLHKGAAIKNPSRGSDTEKSATVWTYCICRMNDNQKVETLISYYGWK